MDSSNIPNSGGLTPLTSHSLEKQDYSRFFSLAQKAKHDYCRTDTCKMKQALRKTFVKPSVRRTMISTGNKCYPHSTIQSGFQLTRKLTHAAEMLVGYGLTCACARAIWEFPSPTRTPSSWLRCYFKWMTCRWFPERRAGACRDMTNTYSADSSVKAARPWLICNMPTELWTSSATHISWPRSCAFLLPRRSRSETLLFGWLDGPSHYSSKWRSLSFYRSVRHEGGMVWIRVPQHSAGTIHRRK